MTGRQKLLKAVYPALMGVSKLFGGGSKPSIKYTALPPIISFYSLHAVAGNGADIAFDKFKGRKVLLVNTASDCGYTAQYDELQKLHELYKDKLVIIGFPANDFKEQEKGSDEQIAQFCKLNFGVSFLLAKKSSVIKSPDQNEVFAWLSDKTKNGWNDKQPSWNFTKYLVDENGVLTHYFEPYVSPLSPELKAALE